MLEKIQKSLIELVLESIRDDRKGTSSVPTAVLNGVINSFVDVENSKKRIAGDPSSQVTVSICLTVVDSFFLLKHNDNIKSIT